MNRRRFLALASLIGSTPLSADDRGAPDGGPPVCRHRVEIDDVHVRWHHETDRFVVRMSTPSRGWLAFGINDRPGLAGTRFVMAAVSAAHLRVSERLALVPEHVPVTSLGLAPVLLDATGRYRQGRSSLDLALRRAVAERPSVRLREGSRPHLMLAWSRETDFAHHSAWRRHVAVEL